MTPVPAPGPAPAAGPPAPDAPGRIVREVLLLFAVATAIGAVVFQVGRFVPLLGKHTADIIAVTFYAVPVIALWRRGRDLDEYGFNLARWQRGSLLVGAATMIVFPAFLVGFLLFYGTVCAPGGGHGLAVFAAPGLCARFHGLAGAHPAWPGGTAGGTLYAFAIQVVAVGLPEEFFFRGFLQGRLEEALPQRRRFLGVAVGRALLLASVLFALGHYLIDFDPRRLAVFFPALVFGWMRTASGSIVPGAVFHALCNLISDGLHRSFFA